MCNFLPVLAGLAERRSKTNRKETQSSSRAGAVDRDTSSAEQAEMLRFIYKVHLIPAAFTNSLGEPSPALSWKTQFWDRGPCNEFSSDICQQ